MDLKNNSGELIESKKIFAIHKNLKIDFTNCKIICHDYLGDFNVKSELAPLDYLQFAKEDLEIGNSKGLIDGLCNAKRAIDCQIDAIIDCLGYDYLEFDKGTKYLKTKEFVNNFYKGDSSNGITSKIKFLNVLGLMPTLLIAKFRSLRNVVEHEYVIPNKIEVQEAIEVAELFIYSSNKKISDTVRQIYLGSNFKVETVSKIDKGRIRTYESTSIYPKFLSIEFDYYRTNKIEVVLVTETGGFIPFKDSLKANVYYDIEIEDKEYPYLLKVIFDKDYKLIPSIIGLNIQKEYIELHIELP